MRHVYWWKFHFSGRVRVFGRWLPLSGQVQSGERASVRGKVAQCPPRGDCDPGIYHGLQKRGRRVSKRPTGEKAAPQPNGETFLFIPVVFTVIVNAPPIVIRFG